MNREELMRVLEMIFHHPLRIEQYLRFAAEKKLSPADMIRIEHLKEFELWGTLTPGAPPATQNTSLIEKSYRCGFHYQPAPFTTYQLRPGTQRSEQNEFLIATYLGALKGKETCNGLHFRIHVCPECLFASSEEHHFVVRSPTGSRTFEKDFDPSPKVRQHLQETFPEREAISKRSAHVSTAFRTAEDALVSFDLAIQTAKVFIETYPDRYGAFWLKTGEYALMAAQICHELQDTARERDYLQQAVKALQEGQISGKGLSAYLNVYRVVLLALRMEDLDLATRSTSRMMQDKIHRSKSLNSEEFNALTKYCGLAKNAIDEYREAREASANEKRMRAP